MIISEEKLITLEAEIGELGEWIAPVFKDDLALLGGRLRDVEGLWYDQNTGECNRNDQNLIEFLSSFKNVFNRRIGEMENLVQAATPSRSVTSQLSLASEMNIITQRMLEATAKDKAGNNM